MLERRGSNCTHITKSKKRRTPSGLPYSLCASVGILRGIVAAVEEAMRTGIVALVDLYANGQASGGRFSTKVLPLLPFEIRNVSLR